ncbi:MAG TPA: hypothetical protein PKC28_07430 [Bdellovibrionales bacterium]|nr:hypothetical protein [Bdellovibrionales bacterium]
MEPRLSSSRKWSPLPKEFLSQVRGVFQENFKAQIGKGKVLVDGRIYPEELLILVGYKGANALKQSNFEVSIAYKKDKDNVLKLLHLAVDAGASLFEQIFTAQDDGDFPRLWQEVDFEGRKIFIQYSTVNSELEAEADKWLGRASGGDVAQGDWDDDVDPETIKAQLGLGDDDDEDGGGKKPH